MSFPALQTRDSFQLIKNFIYNILLLFCGAALFALSNPGFLVPEGISFFAWFAYIPLYILIRRVSMKTVWLYGFIYGVVAYLMYVSWLVIFSPVGSIAIEFEHGVMLLAVFLFLKAADELFPERGWIVQWLIACAYEYLKTIGFAGFSYGITAYTQWQNTMLIQCADLFGVWGLTALILFVSSWFATVLNDCFAQQLSIRSGFIPAVKRHAVSGFIWLAFFVFVLVYGGTVQKDYSKYPSIKVAACQHNTDPWIGGIDAYERDIRDLMQLSDQALASDPGIKLIVWPETSVVPSIIRHYQKRTDRDRFELIKTFLTYVNGKSAVFVVGNDHAVDTGTGDTEDFNAVMVFTPGKNVLPPDPEIYKKIHLVPFTEYFPWPEQFPGLYQALLHGDTHLWTPGTEVTVFHAAGLSFSTPVCFEDTFGDGCRDMYRAGARVFVNLTNDAWSKSLACQNQHLAMATFRCIENRIPAVRSTASGQTCIIDPNGRIQKMAVPFTQTWIAGEIPVIRADIKPTLYVLTGDIVGRFFVVISVILLAAGIVFKIYRKGRATLKR
jgi:apolipoprotein N-acyltransferase